MGNELEKQYNIKEKPIRLPGSYSYLKFVDHPTDQSTSLIIVKDPHKAGVVISEIILPIKQIKNLSSSCSVAVCRKCLPLALVKPRSQIELKLIIKQIIKLSCELGRIFLCNGRLMLWCEQTRNAFSRSPEEVEENKKSQTSNVFVAGICLVNYLNCVYEDRKAVKKPKTEIDPFFAPKDKKEYMQFFSNTQFKLSKTTFWAMVSEGMKSLILAMLEKNPAERITKQALLTLPYFANEAQLILYHQVSDQLINYEEKQTIILMETLELIIRDRVIFDDLILQEYLTPVLLFLLQKKPEMILSCLIQLPKPPTRNIFIAIKKSNSKNIRLLSVALSKMEKLYNILDEEEYDAAISRTIFCSFQSEHLLGRTITMIPFAMRTIKEPNYKKQIQFQLVSNILENKSSEERNLLLGLKCTIQLIQEDILSNVNKLFAIKYDPYKYEQELEINLHVLELYKLMIQLIEPANLIEVMMPKIQPYLVKQEITDELFFKAKKCVDLIMQRLMENRSLNPGDEIQVNYDESFFKLSAMPKPSESEVISVLKKEAAKNKNPDIVWLTLILEKQQHLTDI